MYFKSKCCPRTPLNGVSGEILLRPAINSENPDNHGRTPLSYAAELEDKGVAKILLVREEAKTEKSDNHCRTLLLS